MDRERLFLETVQENRDRMYRVAMSLLHSGADAEDAVSAAVENAWNHLGRLRNPDALSAYLVRCTVNAAKNELRRRSRLVPLDSVPESGAADPRSERLFEYICGLEEKYRLPLVLRMQERMTEAEIASVLRIPRGTVSTRITRALNILKEQMTEEDAFHAERGNRKDAAGSCTAAF